MTTMTATGQVLGGRYTLDRFLAGGVMGEVWAASDSRMGRTVAVKVLRPNHVNDPIAVERFRHEAKLGASLDHPGIVKVHDVNISPSEEPPWLVQEFIDGRSLSDLIEQRAPLATAHAVHLIAQAAEAAHAAHMFGVVHRDLTPRNLMVTHDDVVKVTDFGIARADALPSLTMTGQVVGTPAYLSPEQVKGQPATARSDVYSLAVVLYECLAGTRPFAGSNPIEVARAHLDEEPPPLPGFVPPPLAAFVLAAMVKDPAMRPSGADEFARRLRMIVPVATPPAVVEADDSHTVPWPPPAPAGADAPGTPDIFRGSDNFGGSAAGGAAPAGPANGVPAEAPAVARPEDVPAARTGGGHAAAGGRSARRRQRDSAASDIALKVRTLGKGALGAAAGLARKAGPHAEQAWMVARPEIRRIANVAWTNRPATRVGLTGVLVIVVAVAAVLFGSDPATGGS